VVRHVNYARQQRLKLICLRKIIVGYRCYRGRDKIDLIYTRKKEGSVMRRKIKSTIVLLLIIVLWAPVTKAAGQEYPDEIRVGLYYRHDAVPRITISAANGIDIGFFNNTFTPLLEQKDNQPLIVQKDGHFVKTEDGQIIEYSPTEGVPYAGEVIGPWHIKIGDTAPDFDSAQNLLAQIRSSGLNAYLAYENGWQVWTGFYPDQKTADENIAHIKSVLSMENISVTAESFSRLVIYDSQFNVKMVYGGLDGYLQVLPKKDNNPYVITVNGKRYRGYIEIRRYTDSDLTVINTLNIEHYLYGVVPAEIEYNAPLEAIKAQAVAARTYTYRNLKSNSKWGFDLTDTVEDQVYMGYDGERASTNKAVDETKGKKMLYNGSLAHVFYFASSGGMTASVSEVWGSEIPYLVSVPDPYESQTSPNYIWEKSLTAEQIKKLLFISNVEIGEILSVSAEEYSNSGRVTALRITGTEGSITYYNSDTRRIFDLYSQKYTIESAGNVVVKAADGTIKTLAIDGRVVISANGGSTVSSKNSTVAVIGSGNRIRKVNMSSNTYVFSGRGWGHGVGMSQEGAKGFARQGFTYDQILKHYYTGITVE
jgi:stage II sporulation protein D